MANILLVEDEEGHQSLIRKILEKGGHQVEIARNAVEGLATAYASVPLIAIIDLHLPEINGLTLIQQLKDDPRLQNIFTIVLTADPSSEAHQRAIALGCDLYLRKPFTANQLVEGVDSLIQ